MINRTIPQGWRGFKICKDSAVSVSFSQTIQQQKNNLSSTTRLKTKIYTVMSLFKYRFWRKLLFWNLKIWIWIFFFTIKGCIWQIVTILLITFFGLQNARNYWTSKVIKVLVLSNTVTIIYSYCVYPHKEKLYILYRFLNKEMIGILDCKITLIIKGQVHPKV